MTVSPAEGLTREQVDSYLSDGFLVLRSVFTEEEMADARREADELLTRTDLISPNNLRCRYQRHVETGEQLFEVFDPVVDIAPCCARLAADERILRPLESIYGEPAELFKDKLIFKPPGATGYALHQDHPGWPGFPESFITVLIAIEPGNAQNGCTVVYRGCHQQGPIACEAGNWHLPASAVRDEDCVPLELQPGDVAFFGCYTPHCSAPNLSGQWRKQLFLSYNARSDGGAQKQQHYAEFHSMLRARYGQQANTLYFR